MPVARDAAEQANGCAKYVVVLGRSEPTRLSDVRLIMHPELLVRAIRCPCLELLPIDLEHQWFLLLPPLQDDRKLEHGMLLRDCYTHQLGFGIRLTQSFGLPLTKLFLVMISNVNLVSRTTMPSKPTRLTHRLRTMRSSAPCMSALASI